MLPLGVTLGNMEVQPKGTCRISPAGTHSFFTTPASASRPLIAHSNNFGMGREPLSYRMTVPRLMSSFSASSV
jgi:hypothetical protein